MKSARIRFLWSFHGLRPHMHPERPKFLPAETWAWAVFVTAGSCLRPRPSFMLRYCSTCPSGMEYEILCMLWAPAPKCTFVTFIYQPDLPLKEKPQIWETWPHHSLSGFLTLSCGHYTQVTCKLPWWKMRIGEPSIWITFSWATNIMPRSAFGEPCSQLPHFINEDTRARDTSKESHWVRPSHFSPALQTRHHEVFHPCPVPVTHVTNMHSSSKVPNWCFNP